MSAVDDTSARSAWAGGVSFFGGILLATVGLFQFLQGLSAVRNDKLYVAAPKYVFEFDISFWGWTHLILGAIAVPVGVSILAGKVWAFYAGIFLAVLSALAQFLFIPYYPLWALTILAIDFVVLWALCVRIREDWTIP